MQRFCSEGEPTSLETSEIETITSHEVVLAEGLGNMAIARNAGSAFFGIVGRRDAYVSLVLGHGDVVANGSG